MNTLYNMPQKNVNTHHLDAAKYRGALTVFRPALAVACGEDRTQQESATNKRNVTTRNTSAQKDRGCGSSTKLHQDLLRLITL